MAPVAVDDKGKGEKSKLSKGDSNSAKPSDTDPPPAKQAKLEKVKQEEAKKPVDIYQEVLNFESDESKNRPADQDNKLYVETCQKLRELMKEILDLKLSKSEDKSALNEKKIQASLLFVTLRKLNRLEKFRIKSARDSKETSRQSLDSFNLQLQNLRYEVLHLKKEVSRNINFRSADQTVELVDVDQFYSDAPDEISQPEQTKDNPHLQKLARLAWELETRKKLENEGQVLEEEKNKMEEVINQKDEKIRELGPHIRKIISTTRPVQEYLNIPMDAEREQKDLARLLSTPLYVLYTQAMAYSEACDQSIKIEIEGNEETAKIVREKGLESLADDDDEEAKDSDNKKKHRGKSSKQSSDKSNHRLLKQHPLYVTIKMKEEENEIEVRFKYLVYLEIVTVQTLLHTHKKLDCGDLMQGSTILVNLYDGDDGQTSPNLKNEYQFKEAGMGSSLSWSNGAQGLPYVWAQRLAGLDFLSAKGQSDRSISYLHMENTLQAIKKRFLTRLQLQKHLNLLEYKSTYNLPSYLEDSYPTKTTCQLKSVSVVDFEKYAQHDMNKQIIDEAVVEPSQTFFKILAKRGTAQLISHMVMKPDFPQSAPIFTLAVYWNGEKSSANTEWIRQFEKELNTGWTDVLGDNPVDSSLLVIQIHRLLVLFDLCLEAVCQSTADGNQEFTSSAGDKPKFLEPVQGPLRLLPLLYNKEKQMFEQRL